MPKRVVDLLVEFEKNHVVTATVVARIKVDEEVLTRTCRDTKCLSVNKHTDQSKQHLRSSLKS